MGDPHRATLQLDAACAMGSPLCASLALDRCVAVDESRLVRALNHCVRQRSSELLNIVIRHAKVPSNLRGQSLLVLRDNTAPHR